MIIFKRAESDAQIRRIWPFIITAVFVVCAMINPGKPSFAAATAQTNFPFKADDPPPPFGPLRMGQTIPEIFAILGLPESGEPTEQVLNGQAAIDYGMEGYYLVAPKGAGLRIIIATMPKSGAIDGVAVGTKVARLMERWGKPKLQNDRTWMYPAGRFVVELRIDPTLDHVSAIMLADLRTTNPDGQPPVTEPERPAAGFRLGDPPTPHRQFPFTREQNRDGARFVWFISGRVKLLYDYIPAEAFPRDPQFRALAANEPPRAADVVWWPDLVGLFDDKRKVVLTAGGAIPLASLEPQRGPAQFFRLQANRAKPQ